VSELISLAKAFGLDGDLIGRHTRDPDPFGNVIRMMPRPLKGYLTKVRNDPLRSEGSHVVSHDSFDGYVYTISKWQPVGERRDEFNEPVDFKKYISVGSATYAATEIEGIPERIFLFIDTPGFDLGSIMYRLRSYRRKYPIRFPSGYEWDPKNIEHKK
jgi:hypothetical protein